MPIQLNELPDELLTEVFRNLNPNDAANVAIAHPEFSHIISDIWQRRVKRHFPEAIPDYMEALINHWPEEFTGLENQHYANLTDKLRRLFYLIKEKKFREIIRTSLTIDELLTQDDRGDSLFSLALANGDQPLLDYFFTIALGQYITTDPLDPDLLDSSDNSLFHWAALCNQNEDYISLLMLSDYDINAISGSGLTPLIIAINHRYYSLVESLLEQGADPNLPDASGNSPLQLALNNNNSAMIHLLIRHGADFKSPLLHNKKFDKPINIAASTGRIDVVRTLLLHDEINDGDLDTGKTPLHAAAEAGQIKIMKYLLLYGANINARDNSGYTPMHSALINNQDAAACLLIENGCEANSQSHNKITPLSSAVLHNMKGATELLLKRHLKSINDDHNHLGMTLLYLATMNNSCDLMSLLIKNGVDVNQTSIDGRTALFAAVILGHYEAARLLLEHCANPNLQNTHGQTPLYVAAKKGDLAMTKLLLRYHANTDYECPHDHLTPSAKAASCGHVEVSHTIEAHAQAIKNYVSKNRNRLFAKHPSATNDPPDNDSVSRFVIEL